MKLTIIGCSGSYPGPDGPASCYLIEADGFALLLDLGNGALGPLQNHVSLDDIGAVCLSHLHADHCLDLCGFWVNRTYHPDGQRPRIPVFGPAGTGERMRRAYDMGPGEDMTNAFDFHDLDSGTITIGPFTVTTERMCHPVECFGIRVAHGDTSLVYSGDTGPTPALANLARGANLLLCEASFVDRPGLPADVHLTGLQAAEHAARAGVDHLVLTHLVPWHDREAILAAAKNGGFDGPIDLAAPGVEFVLT